MRKRNRPETDSEEETTSQALTSDDEEFAILLAPDESETSASATVDQLESQDADPMLDDVKLGEPRTYRGIVYYPLEDGSAAIDTADQTMCEQLRDPDSDLVDTSRPQGDGCDIGAFEVPWSDEPPEETKG